MLIHFNAGGTDRERAKFQVQAMYPVDLPLVGASELTSASLQYLSALESEPAQRDWFHLPTKSKVAITAANIKQLHLFNDKPECILLTLHLPDEPQQVVALYLCGNWWHIDDVLRTSKKSRNGLEAVKCTIERVLVLVLSQLVDRVLAEEQLFSNHPPTENCKLLWIHGEAVAFYSFKQKDESVLGVSSPLSAGMMAVCKKFLIQHKEHRDVLYEVEAPSSWIQRRNIWLNIQIGRYSRSKSSSSSVEVEKDEGTDQL
ncbi:protein FAM169B isoform X2 [Periophthalmus magnuspinnatus]|uniref:protein FAM169B isoform X2 n=1 Tax=Periophthalmus magnuspinnatus TaxID=409849 RepID=UPI002436BB94|nr:protein FAM169B isoform X2 [Periophthalmus magnuspinnatus]